MRCCLGIEADSSTGDWLQAGEYIGEGEGVGWGEGGEGGMEGERVKRREKWDGGG